MDSVLIIEDYTEHHETYRKLLENSGYRVFFSVDGTDAEEIINKEKIKILISDYSLPENNGIDIIKGVSKKHPKIKCILISGSPELNRSDLQKNDIKYFLEKPFGLTELMKIISE